VLVVNQVASVRTAEIEQQKRLQSSQTRALESPSSLSGRVLEGFNNMVDTKYLLMVSINVQV